MIIALDGNVYTGKTSLAKASGRKVIPEHSEFIGPIPEGASPLEIQKLYLEAEKKRKTDFDDVVLDRSFVSLLAHVWALYRTGRADIREEFANLLKAAVEAEEIMIPDTYVHVVCPHDMIKKRFQAGEAGPNPKGTDPMLVEKGYLEAIDEFNRIWFPDKTILTNNIEPFPTDFPVSKRNVAQVIHTRLHLTALK